MLLRQFVENRLRKRMRPVWEPFVSIKAIQDFAEEQYIGTKSKWVKVADLSAQFGTAREYGSFRKAYYWLQGWWHFP